MIVNSRGHKFFNFTNVSPTPTQWFAPRDPQWVFDEHVNYDWST